MNVGPIAIWGLAGLALVVPDSFAVPILVLFLSGVVTFAGWLVKSNQASLSTAKQAAETSKVAADRLTELFERVDVLEKWRLRRAEDNQYNQRDQERQRRQNGGDQ